MAHLSTVFMNVGDDRMDRVMNLSMHDSVEWKLRYIPEGVRNSLDLINSVGAFHVDQYFRIMKKMDCTMKTPATCFLVDLPVQPLSTKINLQAFVGTKLAASSLKLLQLQNNLQHKLIGRAIVQSNGEVYFPIELTRLVNGSSYAIAVERTKWIDMLVEPTVLEGSDYGMLLPLFAHVFAVFENERRYRRSTEKDFVVNPCHKSTTDYGCCVEHYTFDQGAGNNAHIYLLPKKLKLNLCANTCQKHDGARLRFIRELLRKYEHSEYYRQLLYRQLSCAPVRFKPLTVLYVVGDELRTKTFPKFVVTECLCPTETR